MRGHGVAATMAAKPRRFSVGFLLFGALLVCGGIAGYVYFFQPDDQRPLGVSALTTAIPVEATVTIKDEAVESSKEGGVPESTGEANQEKSPVSARMKDPVSPNVLKSVAAKPAAVVPPVAVPQAPARPVDVQEAALKKDLPQPVVAAPLTLSMQVSSARGKRPMGVIPKSWLMKAACCVPMITSRFIWKRIVPRMSIFFSTTARERPASSFPTPRSINGAFSSKDEES